jgi:hypothetical protein
VAGPFELGNEISDFREDGEFLDQLSDYSFFYKDFILRDY